MKYLKGMLCKGFILACIVCIPHSISAYWQQKVNYDIQVNFDDIKHQFEGEMEVTYFNESPDDLDVIYFHLYYNAFQPGSMMDIRSRTIQDPDPRVGSRIKDLKPSEIGFHKIHSVSCGNKEASFSIDETILEVKLPKVLRSGKKTKIKLKFKSQVPVQIRRTGRNNKEGIAYTMTQWYPKLCEYDKFGWHTNPYIGREFHGVWGNFNVNITIDSAYTLGGTGNLQNPKEIGHGYIDNALVKKTNSSTLTWKFKAEKVHDFAWAADKEYAHTTFQVKDGPKLHFFYQKDTLVENWKKLVEYAGNCMKMMSEKFGKYPYEQYSIIQGGDGGMEYPNCTMITSHGSLSGLISVTVHEMIHSWYQGMLATNEAKYAWMDEGFTTFAQYYILDALYKKEALNPNIRSYNSYYRLVQYNMQEPLTTHADHYISNRAYGTSVYSKGAVFLKQLEYIVGEKNLSKGLLNYYNEWKFKHPTPEDFIRVMEKTSSMNLDWYLEHWIGTVNTIDYSIKSVYTANQKTKIVIERKDNIPMPLDIIVTLKNGTQHYYYIPLQIMRKDKPIEYNYDSYTTLKDWPWTYEMYEFEIKYSMDDISSIQIDNTTRLADINQKDNIFPLDSSYIYKGN